VSSVATKFETKGIVLHDNTLVRRRLDESKNSNLYSRETDANGPGHRVTAILYSFLREQSLAIFSLKQPEK
jgi:hypothetical protein